MKSYEDAVKVLCQARETEEKDKIKHAEMLAGLQRFADVAAEIVGHAWTASLMQQIVASSAHRDLGCQCDGCKEFLVVAITAYINGVRVGMEMERDETGGVKL